MPCGNSRSSPASPTTNDPIIQPSRLMAYELNFGTMRVGGAKPSSKKSGRFRIAILGDFSARANSGKLDTGAALGSRKPLKVDCDNFDATLKRFGVKLRLPIGAAGGAADLAGNELDDLHPDQIGRDHA